MAGVEAGKVTERQAGLPIHWAVSPESLRWREFPRPRISPDRGLLIADVGKHEFGVAIQAYPSTRTPVNRALRAAEHAIGLTDVPLSLEIRPPLDLDEHRRTVDAPLTASLPYVAMAEGRRYRIGLHLPTDLVGKWSEPKERYDTGSVGWKEIYQEQSTYAAIVKIDGDPLSELQTTHPSTRIGRHQLFTKFDLTEEEALHPYMFNTLDTGYFGYVTDPSEEEHPGFQTNLVFRSDARVGDESNADFSSQRGLIEVVFATVPIAEKVVGYKSLDMPEPAAFKGGGATFGLGLRGSSAGGTRREVAKPVVQEIKSSRLGDPFAVIRLGLVGQGFRDNRMHYVTSNTSPYTQSL